MNKQLKRKIEAELSVLINSSLATRNKKAAGEISKQIKESVKSIAKKFVKHLPLPPEAEKPAKKVKAKKKKASGTGKKKPSKSAKPAKKPAKPKAE